VPRRDARSLAARPFAAIDASGDPARDLLDVHHLATDAVLSTPEVDTVRDDLGRPAAIMSVTLIRRSCGLTTSTTWMVVLGGRLSWMQAVTRTPPRSASAQMTTAEVCYGPLVAE
jgi:hypothetical protein